MYRKAIPLPLTGFKNLFVGFAMHTVDSKKSLYSPIDTPKYLSEQIEYRIYI